MSKQTNASVLCTAAVSGLPVPERKSLDEESGVKKHEDIHPSPH
ncbi:hypothetical protein THOB06_10289 [Vibrio rotiferianus]|nr:hypothetical protein THOG10_10289 [Vibrio rotiferianus]CAH1556799.1 hypothetical protein THOB06_10289 [Vibrio rotiferianus]